jgi:uncharacterized protein YndB with AHSA1/START domain
MTTCERVRLTGIINVALPPEEAFRLFGPSGDRAAAEGWVPVFPSAPADGIQPGTVFTAAHGERHTTCVVVRHEPPTTIAYSVVTHGEWAGLITVTLRPSPEGSAVTVSYELTTLVPEANSGLRSFAAGYRRYLDHWQDSIARRGTDTAALGS